MQCRGAFASATGHHASSACHPSRVTVNVRAQATNLVRTWRRVHPVLAGVFSLTAMMRSFASPKTTLPKFFRVPNALISMPPIFGSLPRPLRPLQWLRLVTINVRPCCLYGRNNSSTSFNVSIYIQLSGESQMITKMILGCAAVLLCVATFAFSHAEATSSAVSAGTETCCACVCDQGACTADCVCVDGFCVCDNCVCPCAECDCNCGTDDCKCCDGTCADAQTECECSGACDNKS